MIAQRYVITSTQFTGELSFGFAAGGELVEYANTTENMPLEMCQHFAKYGIPATIEVLAKLVANSKSLEARLVKADISFNAFWEAYDNKVDRIEAERVWNKLPDTDKMAALESLPAFNYYLLVNPTIVKIYPMRYLTKRRWEVDYKALAKVKR